MAGARVVPSKAGLLLDLSKMNDIDFATDPPANDDFLQMKGGLYVPRSIAQVQVDLGVPRHFRTLLSFAPTPSDDNTAGYSPGSTWMSVLAGTWTVWICVDSSTGAAVWYKWTMPDNASAKVAALAKDNRSASTAPTVSDDGTQGYSPGSMWVNATAGTAYICMNSNTGAAVWTMIRNPKGTFTSAVDPAVTDDLNVTIPGFEAGSMWYNSTSGRLWICLDPANGAAVWKMIPLHGPQLWVETIVSVATSSISFVGVPALGRDLLITYNGIGPASSSLTLQMNGDTSANYHAQALNGVATTATANESLGATSLRMAPTGNTIMGGEITIRDYTRTDRRKSVTAISHRQTGTATGTIRVETQVGLWNSAAAITRVDLLILAGNFATGFIVRIFMLP